MGRKKLKLDEIATLPEGGLWKLPYKEILRLLHEHHAANPYAPPPPELVQMSESFPQGMREIKLRRRYLHAFNLYDGAIRNLREQVWAYREAMGFALGLYAVSTSLDSSETTINKIVSTMLDAYKAAEDYVLDSIVEPDQAKRKLAKKFIAKLRDTVEERAMQELTASLPKKKVGAMARLEFDAKKRQVKLILEKVNGVTIEDSRRGWAETAELTRGRIAGAVKALRDGMRILDYKPEPFVKELDSIVEEMRNSLDYIPALPDAKSGTLTERERRLTKSTGIQIDQETYASLMRAVKEIKRNG